MADEEFDYEALPPMVTLKVHMVAGAAAGIMEHCVMYPVDCVKTRLQTLCPDPRANYTGLINALHTIVRREGLARPLKGIQAMLGGAGPAHALYFACYEQLKKQLSQQQKSGIVVHGVAGSAATLLHDAIMNPSEVIKQRMQIYNSPYRTCLECGRRVLRNEGVRAFYRSYTTQLTMNVPFQSTHFIFYELAQDLLNPQRRYNAASHVVAGGVAGACAAAITTPLDVCKTLLNTQQTSLGVCNTQQQCRVASECVAPVENLRQAAFRVYSIRGLPGFFRGAIARVVYQAPATALSWSVYEFFKSVFLQGRGGVLLMSVETNAG